MKFEIVHRTVYLYSSPVYLEPHVIRLHPRLDPSQQVHAFDLKVLPMQGGMHRKIGLTNTVENLVWFDGLFERIEFVATARVTVINSYPLNALIYPFTATQLPMVYTDAVQQTLLPCLDFSEPHHALAELCKEMLYESGHQTANFLFRLCRYIHGYISHRQQPDSTIQKAEATLQHRSGSCGDMAMLFMQVCRAAGIASRFVSGYRFIKNQQHLPQLHAWAEVYVPGAGWKGYDPSSGEAVNEFYITLATAASPSLCVPVSGIYRGNAEVEVVSSISIQQLPDYH
jgi:transglutaminase-like putative cysteine protease